MNLFRLSNMKYTTRERIEKLLSLINEGVYEKENEMRLALLAALAGQSILLLGPPGVAKSMVARRLKYVFRGAKSFEYLMSRFSTPDEIFGPISIARLKDSDKYERTTEGYLPGADVVFLDEIWKAGPAIQNTLLTVINEKTFLNGESQMKLPLKLLVGASNELPAEGEGLEALWDRFIIRYVSKSIAKDRSFLEMVMQVGSTELEEIDANLQITADEYREWQKEIDTIVVPESVQHAILVIRKELKAVEIDGTDLKRNVYVSDRRWKNIVRLLRTCAFMHNRKEVLPSDLFIAVHCLWNEPDEREPIARMVQNSFFLGYMELMKEMRSRIDSEMKKKHLLIALQQSRRRETTEDDELLIFDNFYYHVEEHGIGNSYIYIPDFRNLPFGILQKPEHGFMYVDEQKRIIIRSDMENGIKMQENGYNVTSCTLYRDARYLYINGVKYYMHRAGRQDPPERTFAGIMSSVYVSNLEQGFYDELEQLNRNIISFATSLRSHLFITNEVGKSIAAKITQLQKEIATMRADVEFIISEQ